MIKKLRNIIILFCISLLCYNCVNIKTLKDFYVKENTIISQAQLTRLSNYLHGEFYSYEIGRNIIAQPLVFLISESGNKSIILACHGLINECNIDVQIYQIIKKYNKKENDNFKILAYEKKLLIKTTQLSSFKNKNIIRNNKNSKIFFDKIFIAADSCSGDDC